MTRRHRGETRRLFARQWRLIKLAGLTVSTKVQTACHYGTGRANITDNRAASYAVKADVTTAPRFSCPSYSPLVHVDVKVINITIITGVAFCVSIVK